MKCFAFILFLTPSLIFGSGYSEPWGKDADLARKPCCSTTVSPKCRTPLFGQFAETMILFHQEVISPCDGPRSHYLPSSSQYTLEAMRKYGFFGGFMRGCDRLMRENNEDWVYRTHTDVRGKTIKLDPVR